MIILLIFVPLYLLNFFFFLSSQVEDTATTAKQRKEKIAFSLDFTVPPLLSQKALFASGGPSTTLPRKIVAAPVSRGGNRRSSRPATVKEDDYTLPADFQFSSTVLLRLFLKPKTLVSSSPSLSLKLILLLTY